MVRRETVHKEFEVLVECLDHGETRQQQLDLADQITDCINKNQNGVYQAGTGVGKSFAYLIPAILSGRKMFISTATKQLSSQIAEKDLKTLRDTIFPDLSFIEIQGMGNYLCPKRFNNYFNDEERSAEINLYIGKDRTYDEVKDLPDGELLPHLKNFIQEKTPEDEVRIKDIKFLYKVKDLMNKYNNQEVNAETVYKFSLDCSNKCADKINVDTAYCARQKNCEFANSGRCPYNQLMNEIEMSQIIVTNHAFVASLLVSPNPNLEFFKDRDLWIADEGHELENYLIKSFSKSISTSELKSFSDKLFSDSTKNKIFNKIKSSNLNRLYYDLEQNLHNLQESLKDCAVSCGLNIDCEDKDEKLLTEVNVLQIRNLIFQTKKATDEVIREIADEDFKSVEPIIDELSKLYKSLTGILKYFGGKNKSTSYIHYLEIIKSKKELIDDNIILHSTNIKVGDYLQACLGALDPKVMEKNEIDVVPRNINLIALSATMKIGNSFDTFLETIGADKSNIKYNYYDAGTVFNYRSQAILYIPENIPDLKENRDLHFQKFKYETVKLINSSNGGALVLCTTAHEAEEICAILKQLFEPKIRIIYYQDSKDRNAIIEDFRNDNNSVLVGTRGFFQGIDIQGTSLRLVCINKIPFPTPDIISEAKSKIYQQEGKNSFQLTMVAPATQILLQAVGRLIRHTTDNGVVMIMDNRISENKFWLKPLINSLPDFYRTSDFNEVDNFFRKMRQIL